MTTHHKRASLDLSRKSLARCLNPCCRGQDFSELSSVLWAAQTLALASTAICSTLKGDVGLDMSRLGGAVVQTGLSGVLEPRGYSHEKDVERVLLRAPALS